jgi:hypothetical protein
MVWSEVAESRMTDSPSADYLPGAREGYSSGLSPEVYEEVSRQNLTPAARAISNVARIPESQFRAAPSATYPGKYERAVDDAK